jgi:D-glycero-D-manno-heptose 1,7-bisphosphate phosphatase
MLNTNPQRGVILDRDGTLVVDTGFVHRVTDLRLLDGVVPGLRRLAALEFRLVIATNQSGVARGLFSEADMQAFNEALCRRLRAEGITIEAVYCSTVHPTEGIGKYRCDSPLRKPRPGMILQAAAEHDLDLAASYVVGDKKSDIVAGQAAGCRTVLLATGAGGRGEEELSAQADHLAADMQAAAEWIESDIGVQLRIHAQEDLTQRRQGAKKSVTNGQGKAS